MIEFVKIGDEYKCDCRGLYFKFDESFNIPISGVITLDYMDQPYYNNYYSVYLSWNRGHKHLKYCITIEECELYMQNVVLNLNKQIKQQLHDLYDVDSQKYTESKEAFTALCND